MLWAVGVHGISNTHLLRARQLARAGMIYRHTGRSLSLDLMLAGPQVDPAFECNRSPIFLWLQALWDGWAPRADMARLLSGAWARLSRVPLSQVWSDIRGPASALVATLLRLGWSVSDPFLWRTHRGPLAIEQISPKDGGRLADEATERWVWRQVLAKHP
eukprot:7304891-Pyramimonas_sp.AAC.1